MPTIEYYKEQIAKEMTLAETSRKQGNEGRARVCARRGVGIALTWHYNSRHKSIEGLDAIELMKLAQEDSVFTPEVREASARLSARIAPDFKYASSSDPLADAQRIIDYILGEMK